jgi:hypothetical protein
VVKLVWEWPPAVSPKVFLVAVYFRIGPDSLEE